MKVSLLQLLIYASKKSEEPLGRFPAKAGTYWNWRVMWVKEPGMQAGRQGKQGQLEPAWWNYGVHASRKQSRTALESSAWANTDKGIREKSKNPEIWKTTFQENTNIGIVLSPSGTW